MPKYRDTFDSDRDDDERCFLCLFVVVAPRLQRALPGAHLADDAVDVIGTRTLVRLFCAPFFAPFVYKRGIKKNGVFFYYL